MIKKALALIICATINTLHAAEAIDKITQLASPSAATSESSSKEAAEKEALDQEESLHDTIVELVANISKKSESKITKRSFELIKPYMERKRTCTSWNDKGNCITTEEYSLSSNVYLTMLDSDGVEEAEPMDDNKEVDEDTCVKKVIKCTKFHITSPTDEFSSESTPAESIIFFMITKADKFLFYPEE